MNDYVAHTNALLRIMRVGTSESGIRKMYSIIYCISDIGVDIPMYKPKDGELTTFTITTDFIAYSPMEKMYETKRTVNGFILGVPIRMDGELVVFDSDIVFEALHYIGIYKGFKIQVDVGNVIKKKFDEDTSEFKIITQILEEPIAIDKWYVDTCEEDVYDFDFEEGEFKLYQK